MQQRDHLGGVQRRAAADAEHGNHRVKVDATGPGNAQGQRERLDEVCVFAHVLMLIEGLSGTLSQES